LRGASQTFADSGVDAATLPAFLTAAVHAGFVPTS